ncbi:MAG TPA: HAD family hydrolase [Desulfurococcales archaeon]|nr:HAD family hydrolase [Desulfurococcales archaeon]
MLGSYSMNTIKAVIFDLDGTLVKLPIDWDNVRRKVRELLKTDHPLKPLGVGVYEVTRNNPKLMAEAFKLIEFEELKAAEKTKYDSKLYELIKNLKRLGLKLGLVTLQGVKSATIVLRKLNIIDFLDVVVTREKSVYRIEQLKIALKKLNVKPSETLFIGDTVWDREAGDSLGCKTLIVGCDIANVVEVEGIVRKVLRSTFNP